MCEHRAGRAPTTLLASSSPCAIGSKWHARWMPECFSAGCLPVRAPARSGPPPACKPSGSACPCASMSCLGKAHSRQNQPHPFQSRPAQRRQRGQGYGMPARCSEGYAWNRFHSQLRWQGRPAALHPRTEALTYSKEWRARLGRRFNAAHGHALAGLGWAGLGWAGLGLAWLGLAWPLRSFIPACAAMWCLRQKPASSPQQRWRGGRRIRDDGAGRPMAKWPA